jgi:drug/metabolite transporter (DMT)-like permease
VNKNLGRFVGIGMLTLAAVIWGFAFTAQKQLMDHMGPITCNCLRFLIGAAFLFLLVLGRGVLLHRKTGKGIFPRISRSEWKGGVGCGLFLFAASLVQQIGLTESDVGTTAFITALYIVIVPALGVFFRRRVPFGVWLSVALALGGAYLLTVVGASSAADGIGSLRDLFGAIGSAKLVFRIGDILVFACAILYSFHILTVDRFADRSDGLILSMIQFGVAGALGIVPMLLFEEVAFAGVVAGLPSLLYLSIGSCGIAFTLQVLGQARVEPTVASMLMSLESVFGAIWGALVLREIMNPAEIVGCATVFAAILLSQLAGGKK